MSRAPAGYSEFARLGTFGIRLHRSSLHEVSGTVSSILTHHAGLASEGFCCEFHPVGHVCVGVSLREGSLHGPYPVQVMLFPYKRGPLEPDHLKVMLAHIGY